MLTNKLKIITFIELIYILSVSASINRLPRSSLPYDSVGLFKNVLPILLNPDLPPNPNLPKLLNHKLIEEAPELKQQFAIGKKNEDIHLNITQLITKYGFRCEQHTVQTADGYLLTMFRIRSKGPPVFLMHGLFCSSDDWITAGPESGLAYSLARAGYDVWLGNARGNKHSRKHQALNENDSKFWAFSWDEIGFFDLPVMIDRVLEVTTHPDLYYIGHSQGTTAFYVMASLRPEYNGKIRLMVALSSVAHMSHVISPLVRLVSPFNPFLDILLELVGVDEFVLSDKLMKPLEMFICGHDELAAILCANVAFLFTGFDSDQLNITNLPVIYGHFPAGASTKQLVHYGQLVESGEFRKFDYGILSNLDRYRQISPPVYPVESITAPVAIFYSSGDWMSSEIDLHKLTVKLKNVQLIHIPLKEFNHLDFLWAKNVTSLIFKPLLQLLKLY